MAISVTVAARILRPGTVYNYGPDAFPHLRVGSPQHPISRKAAIRVEMEQRLEQASRDGVPVLIVRAGDFFGGKSGGNNWMSKGLVKPGKPLDSITSPNTPGVGHSWAYLADLGETMALLLDRGAQLTFERYHFSETYDATGDDMVDAIRIAAGKRDLKVRPFSWWIIMLLSPFVTLFRETREMRYLWRYSLRLDNDELVAALGHEPRTPLLDGVRRTLTDLKCI